MIQRVTSVAKWLILVILLTVTTQVGGLIYILSAAIARLFGWRGTVIKFTLFVGIYLIATFYIIPPIANLYGRELIVRNEGIQPTRYYTILLNRSYVRPAMNQVLIGAANRLGATGIQINYLDASFPFIDGFPLLPHLSHNDGKKIDLSLVYEDSEGNISTKQRSRTGYGIFAGPVVGEADQPARCQDQGYWQYELTKYLSLGEVNPELRLSEAGSRKLVKALLLDARSGKLFIEPHLEQRLRLTDKRVRYHGCRAVRHDDHLHLQLI